MMFLWWWRSGAQSSSPVPPTDASLVLFTSESLVIPDVTDEAFATPGIEDEEIVS